MYESVVLGTVGVSTERAQLQVYSKSSAPEHYNFGLYCIWIVLHCIYWKIQGGLGWCSRILSYGELLQVMTHTETAGICQQIDIAPVQLIHKTSHYDPP